MKLPQKAGESFAGEDEAPSEAAVDVHASMIAIWVALVLATPLVDVEARDADAQWAPWSIMRKWHSSACAGLQSEAPTATIKECSLTGSRSRVVSSPI